MIFHIKYHTDQGDFSVSIENNMENEHFIAESNCSNQRVCLSVRPKTAIYVDEAYYEYEYDFSGKRVFLNGYQSWTDSREMAAEDKMPGILKIPGRLVKKYSFDGYGDYNFTEYKKCRGFFHGFTYAYIRKDNEFELIGSSSERNGFTVIYFDLNKNRIRIDKDCKGLVIKEKTSIFDIVSIIGGENEVFDRYFERMNIQKPTAKPVTGYTSWYNHYQNINESIILNNLESLSDSKYKYDVFQIDDGFEKFVGDWLKIDGKKFPNGLAPIALKAKEKGMMAGIWLAPFVCELDSDLFHKHQDWIVRNEDGSPFLCGNNWSSFVALDFYNPQVRAYIREVLDFYKESGFDFYKLDFLYAVCALPRKEKTRGQICYEAIEFLRECLGDRLILACGVPLAPCFGMVDYMRIGCDVTPDWNSNLYMRLLHRERPGTKPSVLNTIYRRQLDGRAFLNDPDVFLLREDIKLSEQQKNILITANNLFGSVYFTSDNVGEYSEQTELIFKKACDFQNAIISEVEQHGNNIKIKYILNKYCNEYKFNVKKGSI